jgi:hypothetical protein
MLRKAYHDGYLFDSEREYVDGLDLDNMDLPNQDDPPPDPPTKKRKKSAKPIEEATASHLDDESGDGSYWDNDISVDERRSNSTRDTDWLRGGWCCFYSTHNWACITMIADQACSFANLPPKPEKPLRFANVVVMDMNNIGRCFLCLTCNPTAKRTAMLDLLVPYQTNTRQQLKSKQITNKTSHTSQTKPTPA